MFTVNDIVKLQDGSFGQIICFNIIEAYVQVTAKKGGWISLKDLTKVTDPVIIHEANLKVSGNHVQTRRYCLPSRW